MNAGRTSVWQLSIGKDGYEPRHHRRICSCNVSGIRALWLAYPTVNLSIKPHTQGIMLTIMATQLPTTIRFISGTATCVLTLMPTCHGYNERELLVMLPRHRACRTYSSSALVSPRCLVRLSVCTNVSSILVCGRGLT